MIPPSGKVPEQGPDWFFVAAEACGGGTPDLSSVLMFLGYIGERSLSGEPQGAHEGWGRAQGVGRALHPHGWIGTLLAQLF